jgi:hypothetical protein
MSYLWLNHSMRDEDAEMRLPPVELRYTYKGKPRLRDDWQACKFCLKEQIVFRQVGDHTVPLNSYGEVHCCKARGGKRKPQGTVYAMGKRVSPEALRVGEKLPGQSTIYPDDFDDRPF